MAEIKELVKEVNRLLQVGEPGNISVDDYSHFTGYKPQHIIDAMNEAFSYGGWGFEELSSTLEEGLAIAQVRVWLKDVEFQPTGWGQARITKGDRGDAHKGAQTDAIKKALSYFSIGNRAYLGLLVAPEKGKGNQPNRPVQNTSNPSRPVPQNKTVEPAKVQIPTVDELKTQAIRSGRINRTATDAEKRLAWQGIVCEACGGEYIPAEKMTEADRAKIHGLLSA